MWTCVLLCGSLIYYACWVGERHNGDIKTITSYSGNAMFTVTNVSSRRRSRQFGNASENELNAHFILQSIRQHLQEQEKGLLAQAYEFYKFWSLNDPLYQIDAQYDIVSAAQMPEFELKREVFVEITPKKSWQYGQIGTIQSLIAHRLIARDNVDVDAALWNDDERARQGRIANLTQKIGRNHTFYWALIVRTIPQASLQRLLLTHLLTATIQLGYNDPACCCR